MVTQYPNVVLDRRGSFQLIKFLSQDYDQGGLMTEQPAQKILAAALSTGRVGSRGGDEK